jgi:molybdenum cofactor biosynthesis enzyme MoaA
MNLIKKTKSVCPECLDVIDADILEKKDGIWMFKECKKHGKFKGFVEKDPVFYKKTVNARMVKNRLFPSIMVPITHRCNLKCNFCYVPNKEREDMPIEQFKDIVDKVPDCNVCVTGGEPTLREDLFDILYILKRNPKIRHVSMATNGIKLADRDYVSELKKAGLGSIVFSFNGFSDRIYRETNNRDLLDIKLKALENIREEKIHTAISPTLVRGLNEKDIMPIIEYALDNQFPFYEIRVRAAVRVGVHKEIDPLCASEILDIVAKAIGLNKEYFLNDLPDKRFYHSAHQFNMRLVFTNNGSMGKLLYWDHGLYSKSKIRFSKKAVDAFFKITKNTLLNEGPYSLIKSFFSRYGPHVLFYNRGRPGYFNKLKNTKTLDINIWHWPDRYNIDLNEINSHEVNHMTYDGDILNFNEAMIRSKEL